MIKRILVGVDFSEASRTALDRGAALAQQLDVPMLAMHVLEPPAPLYSGMELPILDPAWVEEAEKAARSQLDDWLAPYGIWLSAYEGTKALVRWGKPRTCLVEEADADTLLVVGQVGHSRLEHFLFGSTAAGVVRHAPCDVLVVRADLKA
ncbi:MAG TPA: universal stress protein [Holophagaceae bacterium]|nr:universal stress protein [Holophagaceae bacterium]